MATTNTTVTVANGKTRKGKTIILEIQEKDWEFCEEIWNLIKEFANIGQNPFCNRFKPYFSFGEFCGHDYCGERNTIFAPIFKENENYHVNAFRGLRAYCDDCFHESKWGDSVCEGVYRGLKIHYNKKEFKTKNARTRAINKEYKKFKEMTNHEKLAFISNKVKWIKSNVIKASEERTRNWLPANEL